MVVTQKVVDFLAPTVRGDGEQVLTNAGFPSSCGKAARICWR
jgi:hypothetical protein